MGSFQSKAGAVTQHFAGRVLAIAPGERLPTTSDIASDLEVGFGTVEKAVTALKEAGVIATRARGQKGTFLLERDLALLWEAAGLGSAVGLMPLPNSLHFVGLATGVTEWFDRTKIPFTLNFKNGARARLAMLLEGKVDFIVVSRRAADLIRADDEEVVAIADMPKGSYYGGHHVLIGAGVTTPREDWVIGVDPSSFDHVDLCARLFPGSPVREIRYVNLPYAVANGEVDATTIHSRSLMPLEIAQALVLEPVGSEEPALMRDSGAVILCHTDNAPLRTAFAETGRLEIIGEVQEAVVSGEREPAY